MTNEDKFQDARIMLSDGRIAYDAVKLAQIPTEGIWLKDYTNHVILVQTRNTLYRFVSHNGQVVGLAERRDGSEPRYLATEQPVNIHGSTWGGSMLKMGYIGVDMHLEFSYDEHRRITTTAIQDVRVAPIETQVAAASK